MKLLMRSLAWWCGLMTFSGGLLGAGAIREEAPLLLGRIEIPALMPSAQRLSALLEQSAPGSSASLGLGIAALSFNPQFRHFDLTGPIALYLYARQEQAGGGLEWCFSLRKKDQEVPETLPDGNAPVYVKEVDGRCFISRRPGLAEQAAMAAAPPAAVDGDVSITLWPATGLERQRGRLRQWRGELAKQFFLKGRATAGREAVIAAQSFNLRCDLLERVLRQSREVTLTLSFAENRVEVGGVVVPVPDSELERFCRLQAERAGDPVAAVLPDDAEWSMATRLAPTLALRQGMVGFMRDLAMESEDRADAGYFSVMGAIWAAWNGAASCFPAPATERESPPFALYHLGLDQSRPRRLLATAGGGDVPGGLFLVLDQYSGNPELRFGLHEGAGEIALIQGAGDRERLLAALVAGRNVKSSEVPLHDGEVLFRRRHQLPPRSSDQKGEVPAGPATVTAEYRFRFERELVRCRGVLPGQMLGRLGAGIPPVKSP